MPVIPYTDMPFLPNLAISANNFPVPDEIHCAQLWEKYQMPEHIRRHSRVVACVVKALAKRASELGFDISVEACHAAGLLHDLAKNYCIKYGGAHALLGGVWTLAETGNFAIAQGVLLHVHWPWTLPNNKEICSLPIFVLYADKRARHDECVTVRERFEDILQRYGKTREAKDAINFSWNQTRAIEERLSTQLDWDLNGNTFNCGRLVN